MQILNLLNDFDLFYTRHLMITVLWICSIIYLISWSGQINFNSNNQKLLQQNKCSIGENVYCRIHRKESCPPLLCCCDQNSILTLCVLLFVSAFYIQTINSQQLFSTFDGSVEFSSIIRGSHKTLRLWCFELINYHKNFLFEQIKLR